MPGLPGKKPMHRLHASKCCKQRLKKKGVRGKTKTNTLLLCRSGSGRTRRGLPVVTACGTGQFNKRDERMSFSGTTQAYRCHIVRSVVSVFRAVLKMAVLHNHKQCSNKPIYLPFDPVLKKYGGTGRSPRNKLRSIGPSWTFKTALRLRSIEPKKKKGKSTCNAKDLDISYDPMGLHADTPTLLGLES